MFVWNSSYRGPQKIFAYTEKEAYAIIGKTFAEPFIQRMVEKGELFKWDEVRPATEEEITQVCLRRLTK